MMKHYRSVLVLIATIMGVSLYAYLGPDIQEKNAERQLETVVATAMVNKNEAVTIDAATGLPVLKHAGNQLIFTADIQDAVASKLLEQLIAAGVFNSTSSHSLILGREPNNYIIFFTVNNSANRDEYIRSLKRLPAQLSSVVFNHQPVVIKVINKEKDVLKVII